MRPNRLAALAALLGVALACSGGAARADGVPAFDKLVSGLGYAITPETGTVVAHFDTDNGAINYMFSGDKTVAKLFISYAIKPDQAGKLPALDMLKANGELTSAFMIQGTADKPTGVEIARFFLVSGLTPVGLRQQVDALTANAKDYISLLDPGQWK